MSTAIAFVPTSMPDDEIWFGNVESFNASSIVITDGFRKTAYTGSFTYGLFGEVSGTLASIKEYRGGELIYEVDEINLDAGPINAAIQRGDSQGAAALVFDGDDILTGSEGPDYLRSYANDDVLNGGGGDDTLEGGPGNDTLNGGSGFDKYVFSGDWGQDVVSDLDLGGRLRFDGYASDDLSVSADGDDRVISFGANEVRLIDYILNPTGWDTVLEDDAPAGPPSGAWSIEPVGNLTPGDIRFDEAAGSIVLNLTRTNADGTDIVYVSTVQDLGDANEGDYTGLSNQRVTFVPGEDRKTVFVGINDDDVAGESDERFRVIVQQNETDPIDVSLADLTFTIVDNDGPVGSAPVVTGAPSADLTPAGTENGITRVTGEDLVDVSDADGDLSFIRFYDATPGTDGGTLTLDGVPISDTFVDVGPAGLDRVAYEAGPNEGVNEITVEAFDAAGNDSDDLTITLNVAAPEVPEDIGRAGAGVVYLSSSTGELYSWNAENDAVALVGDTGVGLTDVAIAPDGVLYGITQTDLYRIDADTAEAFRVGPLAGELFFGVDALTDAQGFDIGPDGVGRISSGNTSVVAVVDLETGAVGNPFGPSLNQGATSSGDLWFAEEGRYFVTTNSSTLLTIAPSTFGEGIADNDFISNGGIEGVVSLAAPSGDQRADLIGFSGNVYYSLAEDALPALPGLERGTLAIGGTITGAARLRSVDNASNEAPDLNLSQSLVAFAGETQIFDFDASDDSDSEGGGLTYSLLASADRNLFEIEPDTGELRYIIPTGIALNADSNSDGMYDLEVQVTDSGGLSDSTRASVNVEVEAFADADDLLLEYFARQSAYGNGPLGSVGAPEATDDLKTFLGGWEIAYLFGGPADTFRAVALTKEGFNPVLAFRGTESIPDWAENFRPGGVGKDEFDKNLSIRGTPGPAATFDQPPTLSQWMDANDGLSLTGHSQGGAQAQLAVLEDIEVGKLVTFNSAGIDRPGTGDDLIDPGAVMHFVNASDIVSVVGDTFIPGTIVYYDTAAQSAFPAFTTKNAHT